MTGPSRRSFLGGAALVALLPASLPVLAQPRKLPRVGYLSGRGFVGSVESDSASGPFIARMRSLGYVEGSTVAYEWRAAAGDYERLPALAADLATRVDVIVAATPPAVRAAMKATSSVPIVMVAVGDPVTLGFVASLRRPGGNVTGVSNAIDDVSSKYLELLRLAVPKVTRVASLANPDNPNYRIILDQVTGSGRRMGIEVVLVEARSAEEIDAAFATMRRLRAGAVIVQADGFFSARARQIGELATAARLPAIAWTRSLVEAGALMSYGQNVDEDFENAANFVDRILRGAHPRDMPVERPVNPKLTVNRRTAAALGLRLPADLLVRANELID